MATYSKIPLSQSTAGQPINVGLSASPGILFHTSNVTTNDTDEVWLYAFNNTQYSSYLTVYWGNTASNNGCTTTINPFAGVSIIFPGLILKGNGTSGGIIYGTSSTPSAINVMGYVNRITG